MALAPNIERLFQAVNNPFQQKLPVVAKGSVITFGYMGQTKHRINDPYPLVIVSDIFPNIIRGLNLHYLTLPYVKNIISNYANNPRFSFGFISADRYIVNAFRSYKRNGISQVKMLDIGFLQNLLKVVRALDVGEIDAMRGQIRQMLQNGPQQPLAQ